MSDMMGTAALTHPTEAPMSTLTIRLPDDASQRPQPLAASRGMSVNKLIEELGAAAIAAHDTEARFLAPAATANRDRALALLARLDAPEPASDPA
jgi:hypothetical protein